MAGTLDTKITLTAVDRVSPTLKAIGASFARMKAAASGIGASFSAVGSAASDFGGRIRSLALVSAAAGGALFGLAVKQGQYAERITMMAQKTGFSTDSLQKWEFAGQLVNLQLEDMVVGMRKLSMNMAKVADPKNDVSKWFKKNHLVDAKGKVLDLETTLTKMADIFQKMPDGAKKLALSTALFGKAGANMIPLLNQGSKAIKDIMKEAEKYGITSEKNLKIQADFDDQVDRLHRALGGLARTLGGVLIPMFDPLVKGMTEWITQNREAIAQNFGQFAKELGGALGIVGRTLMTVGRAVSPVVEALGGLRTVIAAIAFVYIGGLVASFGRLVYSLVMVLPAIYNLVKALWFVSAAGWAAIAPLLAMAAPFIGIAAAVGLVVFALYKLWQMLPEVIQAWNQLWAQVPDSVKTAMRVALAAVTMGMSEIPGLVSGAWESIKASFEKGGLAQVFTDMFAGAKEKVTAALADLLPSFSGFVDSVKGIFASLMGVFDKIVGGIVSIKNSLVGGITGSVNVQTNVTPGASIGAPAGGAPAPAAGAPSASAGLGAKTALNTTPQLPNAAALSTKPQLTNVATNNTPVKQHLDVFMKIDSEGRPKVAARSDKSLAFSSSTGKMV